MEKSKYVIIRAFCKFSNGSSKVINYGDGYECYDIEEFRKCLRQQLNESAKVSNITVDSIALTYEESR